MSNIVLVERFVQAFNRLDWTTFYGMMAPDIIWHNIGLDPIVGPDKVKEFLASFGELNSVDWEVLAIAEVDGKVLTERVDRFVMNGKSIEVPAMGIFIFEDSLMKVWRDYFDIPDMLRQLGSPTDN